MSEPRTLIVIPTYNEKENLQQICAAVFKYVPQVHILVVDDNSPDGTGKIADGLAAADPRVHVLHRPGKGGLGPAYIAGLGWGLQNGFDQQIMLDCDFSHNPKYLPEMIAGFKEADFVIGSRYIRGGGTENWGIGRQVLSRGGNYYARAILGSPVHDMTGGYNGWTRKVLETVGLSTLHSNGYSFQIEIKYRALKEGFKFKEIPIVFADRKVGKSKMSRKIIVEAFTRVWGFRFKNASH